ncbi:hypothetical protein CEXT_499521 [Caerostris extrusa]|uniref:Uncharacterized protein n=1 Tax=Caerostris extrusa TaxID=172846 RepID=A0AAV4YAL1_CAEEX|nr:hypothetical protein CEXT_499521 [Caerostris extrusa]
MSLTCSHDIRTQRIVQLGQGGRSNHPFSAWVVADDAIVRTKARLTCGEERRRQQTIIQSGFRIASVHSARHVSSEPAQTAGTPSPTAHAHSLSSVALSDTLRFSAL